jgi:MFS superfamily sulfate permease-like transporter
MTRWLGGGTIILVVAVFQVILPSQVPTYLLIVLVMIVLVVSISLNRRTEQIENSLTRRVWY